MRKVTLVIAVLGMIALLGQVAVADIDEGTFDDDGTVSADGRRVTTQISLDCEEGDRYKLRVSITQDDTGAFAQKHVPGECTGDDEDLLVDAPARGHALFDSSEETEACALVRTRAQHEGVTDAEQFCEGDINLDEADESNDD